MTYLEDAAAELAKLRDYNGRRAALAEALAAAKIRPDDIDREVSDRSERIARMLIDMAAIEVGVPPSCGCHRAPEVTL
jgi:hypothetical protein